MQPDPIVPQSVPLYVTISTEIDKVFQVIGWHPKLNVPYLVLLEREGKAEYHFSDEFDGRFTFHTAFDDAKARAPRQ